MSPFAVFIAVPILEMALLIWIGGRIGLGWTLGIVVVTAVAGAALVKRQGLSVWASARRRLAEGGLPTAELAHGAMLVLAGAFLLTPGFLTDSFGFALLVPAVREQLRLRVGRRIAAGRGPVRVDVWR